MAGAAPACRVGPTPRGRRLPSRWTVTSACGALRYPPAFGDSVRGSTSMQGGGPMTGQIVHFEIPADDTTKSREFWRSLFGWQFEAYPGPFEYHMTRISDQAGLAITNMEPGKPGTRASFRGAHGSSEAVVIITAGHGRDQATPA